MAGVIWFLSDTHFNHKKIYEPRGFSTLEEHDNTVADSITRVVRKRDTLILLGDIAFSPATYDLKQQLLESHKRVHGTDISEVPYFIKVVQGNHDKSSHLDMLVKNNTINSYQSLLQFKINSLKLVATHVPLHPACLDRWGYNIHGHTHSVDIDCDKMINVSWEKFKRPISINEIESLINGMEK